jgi:hypothetical protein
MSRQQKARKKRRGRQIVVGKVPGKKGVAATAKRRVDGRGKEEFVVERDGWTRYASPQGAGRISCSAIGGDGMTEAEWWMDRYRAAATSVARGNILEEMALEAHEAGDTSLKRFVLQAAEASTDGADEHLRVRALGAFRWLGLPDEEYRRRVIDWVLGRIERADRQASEPTYAVSTCKRWIREPRVQARLLGLVNDETEEPGLRLLALDCFTLLGPGDAFPELTDTCRRLTAAHPGETDDDQLGRKARRVLANVGE